ncbi:PucR family transcriptional regulator [Alkalihalobacterium alkalinitrilicum]|uniref:PucR family transcriptional regulator n=1 Tax=Alkalihalobacterium alkalinitrilicum TaxID=427920 RepID=UPI000994EC8E|nr:PucR family transcriptional regulator [Alkalihalobacterium alkalinitrilicum]
MTEQYNRRGLTVDGLLELEPLAGARIIAGDGSCSNVISRVNIIGSPEVLNFVRPQEFIMTTGYPFRDQLDEFAELIKKLHDKNVAGIGIKIQRFIPAIPQSLIDIANELNFPVVEIPPTAIFSDIIRVAMEEIFYQESEHIITLYDRIQKFTNLIIEGRGIPEIIYELEQMIGNPVVLHDLDGNIIAPLMSDVLNETELRHTVQAIEAKTGIGLSQIKIREESFYCFSSRLTSKGILNYIPFIACIETNYQLTEVDHLTIEKISTMLNMEIANRNTQRKIERKYLNQFVKNLMLGDMPTKNEIEIQRHSIGVDFEEKWFQVFILDLKSKHLLLNELHGFTENVTRMINGTLLVATIHERLVFLLIENTKDLLRSSMTIIDKETERFLEMRQLEGEFVLCIGDEVDQINRIQYSYNQAKKVYSIYGHYDEMNRMIYFDQLHVYRFLYLLPESDELIRYINEILGPLELDQKKGGSYLETLEAYFQCNRNIRMTAEKLFTHYNTIIYRIERITKLLEVDLENSEVALEIQLALKLRKMQHYVHTKNEINEQMLSS